MDQTDPIPAPVGAPATMEQIWLVLDRGGPIIWILLALATVAIAIILIKLWQFSAARIERRRSVDQALTLWTQGRRDPAIEMLRGKRQPLAQVAATAMKGVIRNAPETLTREEAIRLGNADLASLRSYLRPLELIAMVSPLLGLLGTVIGMIDAFQSIDVSAGGVDPSVLSTGIWQALLTTAVGLSVAIPVTLAHSWLDGKVDRLSHAMEDAMSRVFTAQLYEND